jgi:hypothetical protein
LTGCKRDTNKRGHKATCQEQQTEQNPEIEKGTRANESRQYRFMLALDVTPDGISTKDGAMISFHEYAWHRSYPP